MFVDSRTLEPMINRMCTASLKSRCKEVKKVGTRQDYPGREITHHYATKNVAVIED